MYGIIAIITASALTIAALITAERRTMQVTYAVGSRLQKLWRIAQQGISSHRYLKAEKALLTILRLDNRNAAAYNHLGILYSRQKEYRDAIECFEIASSIRTSAATLHNLGLIYYETEDYEKSASAFEHALQLEDSLGARHIAYAKVLEHLGRYDESAKHMLKATDVDPSKQSMLLAYEMLIKYGYKVEADRIKRRLQRLSKQSNDARLSENQRKRLVY